MLDLLPILKKMLCWSETMHQNSIIHGHKNNRIPGVKFKSVFFLCEFTFRTWSFLIYEQRKETSLPGLSPQWTAQ
jgi:hypothetical protein